MDQTRASTRAYGPGAGRTASGQSNAPLQTSQEHVPDRRTSLEQPAELRRRTPQKRKVQKRTSVGPWDFVKSVGAGSMGQVKLAVNRYTRQTAAVKIVPKAFTQQSSGESNETRDARVVREAALGKVMLHDNIAQLYEVYSMSSHYYLVFEYINGGQLLDYIITHGSVSEVQARKFAREIASALDYCHRNSIVHRDLKIENILVAEDGSIKIIDFGLSNLFRRDDLLKTFCGSLYFAAPELLNAQPYLGPEIDVWSFGVVLYVLVCGKVPFEDKSMSQLHAKIKRGHVEFPHWLSPLCTDLLKRMLVVAPAERASMREILHHPWINKGYDQVPAAHVPERVPLQLPLDLRVVDEMAEMKLGAAADIEYELESVLKSHAYQDAINHHDSYRRADPLNSFHPLISLYFLTRERLVRLGYIEAAAQPPPQLALHTPSQDTLKEQSNPTTPTIVIQEPAETKPFVPLTPKAAPQPQQVENPQAALSPPARRMRSRTQGEDARPAYLQPQGLGISEDQNETRGLTSLFRHISIRKRSDSRTRTGSRTNSPAPVRNRNRSATTAQHDAPNITVETPASKPSKGHSRAKSTSHTDPAGGPHAPATPKMPDVPDMPSIMAPKQVFFRGFFSVQSTSSKPLVQIRSDIINVLTDLGIEFVEIKGGFSCIHGHQANTHSYGHSPKPPSRQGHIRQISMGTPISSPRRENLSDSAYSSEESFEMGGSDMLGHAQNNMHAPVRFEISIVKVPVLSLHGVQFKKIGGNAWQYKTIAQEILERLQL